MRIQNSFMVFVTSLVLIAFIALSLNLSTVGGLNAYHPSLGQDDEIEVDERWEEEETDNEDEEEPSDDLDEEDEWEDEEPEEEEWGEFEEMEMERMDIESNIGRLEMINRLADIASNETAVVSYAILHMEDFFEEPEEAIELLESLLESDDVSGSAKNLLRMKLAEVYSMEDRREDAMRIFKSMITGK